MAKKKKYSSKEEVVYVGVYEPNELRRTILESAKITIKNLQRYERFKKIKREKREDIIKLKTVLEELNRAVNKFKSKLPKYKGLREHLVKMEEQKIKVIEMPKAKKRVEKIRVKKARVPVVKKYSHLEKLSKQLSDIDKKLKSL